MGGARTVHKPESYSRRAQAGAVGDAGTYMWDVCKKVSIRDGSWEKNGACIVHLLRAVRHLFGEIASASSSATTSENSVTTVVELSHEPCHGNPSSSVRGRMTIISVDEVWPKCPDEPRPRHELRITSRDGKSALNWNAENGEITLTSPDTGSTKVTRCARPLGRRGSKEVSDRLTYVIACARDSRGRNAKTIPSPLVTQRLAPPADDGTILPDFLSTVALPSKASEMRPSFSRFSTTVGAPNRWRRRSRSIP